MSIQSFNSMLTKLRICPTTFWSPLKVKAFSSIGNLAKALGIITLAISLYCKCFENKMGCVCIHTRPTTPPKNKPTY